MESLRRIILVENHLSSKFPTAGIDTSLEEYRKTCMKINPEVLTTHYFDSYDILKSLRAKMESSPLFTHAEHMGVSVEEYRAKVVEQIKLVYSNFEISYEIDKVDPIRKFVPIYAMAEYDLALSVRVVVHNFLYIDTLQSLGTSKHRSLIDRAYKFVDYGSFGMTELGHGSNVASVETIATYDPTTGGFILNSPTPTSAKWWIGALANTANISAIFAQLIVDGVNKGVHVFATPIRNYETHEPFPGVTIGDCGKKIALDGIDNGFIIFKDYKIAYDCLLDRLSQIRDGKFKSAIKNKEKRLGIMMAGLIRGRYAVVTDSEINARQSLTIALRYAAVRKQFGGDKEISIMNYQLHKHRLVLGLAKTIAIRCGSTAVLKTYLEIREKAEADPECDELNELHSMLSSLKVVCTWISFGIIQECREACGGHGFSSYSALGRIRGYQDVHMTWEGDNSVLLQQTGKYILKILQKSFKGQKLSPSTLKFLKFDAEEIRNFKATFTTKEELLSESLLISLLEHRVNYLLHQCVVKLQENSMVSTDMTEAWNNSQVFYIQDLSKSYGELLMAKEFVEFSKIIEAKCKETANVLRLFSYLFMIDRVVSNLASYLDGCLTPVQGKLMKDSVTKLCDDLTLAAIPIVDALAASDKIIGSTIGASDGQAYSRIIQAAESEPTCYVKPKWLPLVSEIRKLYS